MISIQSEHIVKAGQYLVSLVRGEFNDDTLRKLVTENFTQMFRGCKVICDRTNNHATVVDCKEFIVEIKKGKYKVKYKVKPEITSFPRIVPPLPFGKAKVEITIEFIVGE